MNIKRLKAGLALSISNFANARLILEVDLSVTNTITINATSETSLITERDHSIIGFYLKDIFGTDNSGFSAACYHRDLEPFMARGRALKAMGKSRTEIFEIREEEAKSGKLDMGKPGSTLHIYYGQDALYDPKTSEVDGAIYRYVVYLQFATSASTGLPEQPISSNHPWIMNPGTHKAHIMISPKSDKN